MKNLPGFTAEASLARGLGSNAPEDFRLPKTSSASIQITPQLSIPVHGNWCGPGHGGGPAIDAIDAVCRTHDQCYGNHGYSDCRCDRNLITSMPRAIARTSSAAAKAKGAAIMTFFSVFPCLCHHRVCTPRLTTCHKRVWGVRVPYPCFRGRSCRWFPTSPGVGGRGPC